MKKPKATHGGKRLGAGRPPKARNPPAERIDPETVLHQIAGDTLQPAGARVAAAKALIAKKPSEAEVSAAQAFDLEARTLAILNKGRPN